MPPIELPKNDVESPGASVVPAVTHDAITDTLQDQYDLSKSAFHLARVMVQMAHGGHVIAINAPWGAGKTSLFELTRSLLTGSLDMRLLERFRPARMDKAAFVRFLDEARDERYRFVEFNAWMDLSESEISVSLCDAIHDSASGIDPALQTRNRFFRRARRNVGSIVGTVAGSVAGHFGFGGNYGSQLGSLVDKHLQQVEKEFENAKATLARSDECLVIVIDDIDRMPPARINELILALRWVREIFKSSRICFLLLYDHDQVIDSMMRSMFAGLDNEKARHSATLFLEKIVQYSFLLPRPTPADLMRTLESRLAAIDPRLVTVDRDKYRSFDGESRQDQIRRLVLEPVVVTPRAVNRLVTNIRYSWQMKNYFPIDGLDLVALEAILLFTPNRFADLGGAVASIRAGRFTPEPLSDRDRVVALMLPAHHRDAKGRLFEEPEDVRVRNGFGDPDRWDHYLLGTPSDALPSRIDMGAIGEAMRSDFAPKDRAVAELLFAARQGDLAQAVRRLRELTKVQVQAERLIDCLRQVADQGDEEIRGEVDMLIGTLDPKRGRKRIGVAAAVDAPE